jgi:hypothetical protein
MSAIGAYLERLPVRLAEMKLAISEAVSFPHLKDDDRSDLLDLWKGQARLQEMEAEIASPAVLRLLGVGVVMTPPPSPGLNTPSATPSAAKAASPPNAPHLGESEQGE